MGTKLKRVMAIILALSLVILSFGCSKDEPDAKQGASSGNEQQGTGSPSTNPGTDVGGSGNSQGTGIGSDILGPTGTDLLNVQPDAIMAYEIPLSTEVEDYYKAYEQLKNYHLNVPADYKEFFDCAERARDIGVDFKSVGADIAGAYYIHFSGSCVTSVRNCIDEILKKRGISVEEGIYTDWKDIVSINYTCPAPYYMQSVYNVYAGNMDEAKEYYNLAKLNEENYPNGLVKLEGITSLSDEELKTLRKELVDFEYYLYDIYPAIPSGLETTGYEFMPEFFLAAYYYCLELDDYENALAYADEALRCNPTSATLYKICALTALQVGDGESAWNYINNGLMLDNEEGDLITLAVAFWVSIEDYDNAKEYLELARMGSLSPENEESLQRAEAKMKEAGR